MPKIRRLDVRKRRKLIPPAYDTPENRPLAYVRQLKNLNGSHGRVSGVLVSISTSRVSSRSRNVLISRLGLVSKFKRRVSASFPPGLKTLGFLERF